MELVNWILGGEMYGELQDNSTRFRTAFKSGSNDDSVRAKFTVHATKDH